MVSAAPLNGSATTRPTAAVTLNADSTAKRLIAGREPAFTDTIHAPMHANTTSGTIHNARRTPRMLHHCRCRDHVRITVMIQHTANAIAVERCAYIKARSADLVE